MALQQIAVGYQVMYCCAISSLMETVTVTFHKAVGVQRNLRTE